jgi:branched-chain amino acid transport system ATP-binding protein
MSLLEVNGICCFYGTAQALFDVSLEVGNNEVVCLLGRNGAGKTSTLRSILGIVRPKKGSISFEGKDITNEPVHERVKMGIGYVPDYRGIFSELSCLQNLKLATVGKRGDLDAAFKYFPELRQHLHKKGRSLSGGEQRMCALGRALILNPKLILLDEPLGGLAPVIVNRLATSVRELKKERSILLVEENAQWALDLADRVYIMQEGKMVFGGTPQEASAVIKKYLAIA